jgi:hypothetical protein
MLKYCLILGLIFSQSLMAMGQKSQPQLSHAIDKDADEKAWSAYSSDSKLNLERLFELLSRSPQGLKLIQAASEKAKSSNQSLFDVIEPGDGSITDTTLVRRFGLNNPEIVEYETRSKVFINRFHNTRDALFDLAHELTHYLYRTPFNPYQINFTLEQFVRSTVEGTGGEVDAFMMECRVMSELYPKYFKTNNHCQKIISSKHELSRELAINEFYKLGNYLDIFKKELHASGIKSSAFSHLSNGASSFISSAYGMPYPIAAVQEYQQVLKRACENDKNRLGYFEQKRRSPASGNKFNQVYGQFAHSYKKRCQH